MKTSNQATTPASPLTSSPLEFSVIAPATMKVPANGAVIVNIQAKLKNSYQLANLKEAKALQQAGGNTFAKRSEKYNHLMIAKIKDT